MAKMENEQVASLIRDEIKKYHDDLFSDDDDFTIDMKLLSDDLSAIALSLEHKLGVRLDRNEYRCITNVRSYTEAVSRRLGSR
jgi:hypothetical protein